MAGQGWLGIAMPFTKGIIKGPNGPYIRFAKTRKVTKNGVIWKQKLSTEERIKDFFKRYAAYVYIGMCIRFAETAAKYTPPNMGQAKIDQKYYSRPIYKLDDLAKGLIRTDRGRRVYATREDFAALRAGYKFKVVNSKYGLPRELKNVAVAYTKGINEAKRAARIQNRGLSKYSWGANLNNIKEDLQNRIAANPAGKVHQTFVANRLPPIFQRLAKKSPNITRYTWGSYYPHFIPNDKDIQQFKIRIVNRLAKIEAYGNIAIKQAILAARKYANNLWKGIDTLAMDQGTTKENQNDDYQIAIKQLRSSMTRLFEDVTNRFKVDTIYFRRSSQVPEGQIQIRRIER